MIQCAMDIRRRTIPVRQRIEAAPNEIGGEPRRDRGQVVQAAHPSLGSCVAWRYLDRLTHPGAGLEVGASNATLASGNAVKLPGLSRVSGWSSSVSPSGRRLRNSE